MFNITEPLPPVTLTVKDIMALDGLLMMASPGYGKNDDYIAEYLERELNRAHVVADNDLPDHVVRMHSTVTYSTNTSGKECHLTLVYPVEADIDAGKVSVMTPIGAALIGLTAGDSITYFTPNGGAQTVKVIAVAPPGVENLQQLHTG
ncbi:MAG: nucleoside diphosphate kinase regulator [Alphaproteobacteria bacterium]|nr:nucleoside diphosphate kinase regulator [Alphaproteobacteria bacterium]